MNDIGVVLLGVLAISIVVFAALRETACWYWKQNEIIDLLKKINDNLKTLVISQTKRDNRDFPEDNEDIE